MSTAPTPLSSSINKLQRAWQLQGEIQQAYMSYLMSKPYQLEAVADPSIPGYRVTTNYTPPIELPLLFGDFVHNLRCALDHLARELLIEGGGKPKDGTGGTMFPIHKQPVASFGIKADGNGAPKPDDLARLESIQPYKSSNPLNHPLYQISELDNIDKHRHINVVALAATAHVAFRSAEHADEPLTEETPRYLINPSAGDIQDIQVKEPLVEGKMAVQGMHTSQVVLREPTLHANQVDIIGLCAELYDFVAREVFLPWIS